MKPFLNSIPAFNDFPTARKVLQKSLSDLGDFLAQQVSSAQLNGKNQPVQNVASPVAASDAATKGYVDGLLGGGDSTSSATSSDPWIGRKLIILGGSPSATITAPAGAVVITPRLDVSGRSRVTGNTGPTTGAGVEMFYTGAAGGLVCFDRDASAFKNFALEGDPVIINATSAGKVGVGGTPTYTFDVTGGDINTSGVYRKGGTAGLSVTRNFGASLTVNSVNNAVQGTPGASQSNFTAVTSVSLNLTASTYSGGILTA